MSGFIVLNVVTFWDEERNRFLLLLLNISENIMLFFIILNEIKKKVIDTNFEISGGLVQLIII